MTIDPSQKLRITDHLIGETGCNQDQGMLKHIWKSTNLELSKIEKFCEQQKKCSTAEISAEEIVTELGTY